MAASNLTVEQRFEIKIIRIPESGCWIYGGCLNNQGYGQFAIKNGDKWVRVLAHRFSYTTHVGDIGNKHVLHRCDTPSCVNPAHLFLGTHQENMQDCSKKGRTHTPRVRPKFEFGYKAKGTYRTKPLKVQNGEVQKMIEMNKSGMYQKDIAIIYGITQQQVSNILRGKRVEDNRIHAIC